MSVRLQCSPETSTVFFRKYLLKYILCNSEKLFEGFFGELKNIIKSGVNAIKEQKEIMAQIFSAENLSKFAESINAELQNSGESTENKEALKKVLIKVLLPEFENSYKKSKYVKNNYSLDEWRKMAIESIDNFFIKK